MRMHSTSDRGRGKLAVTHFRVLNRLHNLTMLEVTLETGRKNQIRVHLSEMGHPIVGDRAYGSTQNPLGRLGSTCVQSGIRASGPRHAAGFSRQIPPRNSAAIC